MGTVVGDLLPLAVGVAISPIPIVAVVLMLLSRNARITGIGFAVGWVTGILLVTAIVLTAAGSLGSGSGGGGTAGAWVKTVLGVLLIVLALRQWWSRADTSTPKWMRAIDEFTFGKAAGLAVVLSAVNPKNLLLCVSAGIVIGTGGLGLCGDIAALLVYTLVAAASVLVPVCGYLAAANRISGALATTKDWLQTNNHAVMAIVLLIMGAVVLGKGIGGLG
ncbi:GAP family protein [Nocardia flavorosea]|uniref:GAP family protein n=1 Tax=Nocardia flavorosea TaxID=53429 RepID=UPI001894B1DB|nr:GAP family protein [Nocardia flavorosea]MBF6348350.1 GAP family protein [Nocardia flavorosea]